MFGFIAVTTAIMQLKTAQMARLITINGNVSVGVHIQQQLQSALCTLSFTMTCVTVILPITHLLHL
jgi:hypothetical protein